MADGEQAETLTEDSENEGAPLPVPTKENNWLGFCQSAVKLQNGDRKVGGSISQIPVSHSNHSMNFRAL